MNLALVLFLSGAAVIVWIYIWARQQRNLGPLIDIDQWMRDVPATLSGDAVLAAREHGKIIYANDMARRWLKITQETPNLEQLVQLIQPSNNFLELLSTEGQSSFQLGDRWVAASSHRVSAGGETRMVIVMRELSATTKGADLLDIGTAMTIINEIGETVDASMGLSRVLQNALLIIKQSMGYDAGEICLWNEREQALYQRGWIGDPSYIAALEKVGGKYRLDEGITGWIARHREPVILTGPDDLLGLPPKLTGNPYKSYLGVPLLLGERFLGTLEVANLKPKAYTPGDIALFQAISRPIAVTIGNAEIYEQQVKRVSDLAHLQEIITTGSESETDTTIVYLALTRRIAELAEAEMCGVFLYDSDRNGLAPQIPFYGLPEALVRTIFLALPAGSPQHSLWEKESCWLSNEVKNEPLADTLGLRAVAEVAGIRNMAWLPLQLRQQRIGALAICNKRARDGFTDQDIENLTILTAQAAVVVENVRLYQREQRMDTELVGLQEIAESIGALSHETEFYGEITERIAKLMGITLCGILLYDKQGQRLVSQLPFYGVDSSLVAGYTIPLTPGSVMAQLWEEESFWYSNRVRADALVFEAGLDELAEKIGVEKTLLAVLHAGGESLGVVQVSNKRDGTDFTDSDARLLLIFATQAAALIQNARLYREVQQSAEQAQGLRRVAELAGNVLTTQETFAPVLAEIAQLLDSELVFINVLDQQRGSLITYPRWVYGAELGDLLIQDIASPGFERSVVMSHQPYLGNDILHDTRVLPGYAEIAARLHIQNAILVPLIFSDRTLGELGVGNRFSGPYTREDLSVMKIVAAQAAAALDRLLLYEATGQTLSRRMDELDAISRVSNELAVTLDLERILNIIREEAINATKVDGATIVLFGTRDVWVDDDTPTIEYRLGYIQETLALADIERAALAAKAEVILVKDYQFSALQVFPPGVRSALAIAIQYLDQPVGMIHLYHNEPSGFDDRAAAFVKTLAAKASVGYGNAMRYQEQLDRSNRLRRRVEQLNRIFELGHMFQTSNDPADILEAIAYSVQQSVGYDTVLMALLNESVGTLQRVAHAGLPIEVFERTRSNTISKAALTQLLNNDYRISESFFFPVEERERWAVGDISALDTHYEGQRVLESPTPELWHDGDKLLISLYGPSGVMIGIMALDRPHDNNRPDRGTIEILEIFAHQAATMIENTRLYRSSMRSAEQEARLSEVMEAVSKTLDITEIVRAAAQGTRRILPFERMTVALREVEEQGFDILNVTIPTENALEITPESHDALTGALLRSFQDEADYIYRADDPQIDQYDDLRAWHKQGEKTSLIFPMTTGGETLGVLHIGCALADGSWEEYQPLLQRVAQLVASAVQNARLFNQAVNLRVLNESVVESIQQGIVVLNNTRQILSANEFMIDRFGWDHRSFGKNLFAYRPQITTILAEDLDIVLQRGVPRERLNQVYTVTDDHFIVSNFYLYPLRYGELVRGAVLLVEDFTERAQLEQVMEARANQLAALTEISNHITASLERNEVIQLALTEMGWLIPHNAMSLWRRTGSHLILEGATGHIENITPEDIHERRLRVPISRHELVAKVVDTQRVVTIGNSAQLTGGLPVHQDVQSWLGVPLVNQGHVVGLMMLSNSETNAYENPSDQNIALAFAGQVAIAEANADLFEQTFDRTNELGTLLEAAQATSLTTDLDSIFRIVVELMFSALDMDHCIIMLWYEVDNVLEIQLDVDRQGETDRIMPRGTRLDLDLYPAKLRALQDRDVVVIAQDDPNNPYPDELQELSKHGSLARLLVPLVVRENSMGLIQLDQRTQDKTIKQQKIRLARALGAQVAVAIENARLSAQTTAHIEESIIVNDLSRAISSTLNLEDMIAIVRDQVPGVAGAAELYLALYDAETQEIVFPLAVKDGQVYHRESCLLNTDEVSFIIRHRHPLNLGADYYSPDELRSSLGIRNGEGAIKSYLGVPLIAGDEVYGVLAVRDTQRTRAFTINEQRILTTVGSQLGAAIQNARLYKRIQTAAEQLNVQIAERTSELKDERDRLDILYQITSELAQTLDEERLMPNALHMVAKAVSAEDGVIMQLDPITDQLYSGAVLDTASLQESTDGEHAFHPAEQLARWLIAEDKKSVLVRDLRRTKYWNKDAPGSARWRSALAVMLETNEELLGVMVLLNSAAGAFTPSHLRLVIAAANQVASSINNAQLYRLIRDQAERLGTLLRTEQESAEKNKAILEGIADGVILADDNGRIVLFNTAAERILQIPREQVLNHALSELTGLETIASSTWAKALESRLENLERDTMGEFLDERLTLGDRTVSIHLSPVYTGDRFLGTVSVFRDITREVLADRSKSEFVANVSHELRTPLTSIKGYNDLLLMGALGELSATQKNAFDRIKDNVTRLASLVEDVLLISQIDTGVEQLIVTTVNLNDIVARVLQELQTMPQHQHKAFTVIFNPLPSLPRIQADAEKITQVMHNLIDNAFNYTRRGGTIEISVRPAPEKEQLLIMIKDTGVGIPEDFREKVWERFERHEDTVLALEVAGTGLGLPIAKEMIELHSGKIWFETTLDVGTAFYVQLPYKQPEYMMGTGVAASSRSN